MEYNRENVEKVAETLVDNMSLDQLKSYVYDNLVDHMRYHDGAFDDAVETLNLDSDDDTATEYELAERGEEDA